MEVLTLWTPRLITIDWGDVMTRYLVSIWFLIASTTSMLGQGTETPEKMILSKAAGSIGSLPINIVDATVHGFVNAQVPGGVVRIIDCNGREAQVSGKDSRSIQDLLNLLVLKAPEYRWKLDDGVINLMPNTGFPVPLDIRLPNFKMENGTALEAMNELVDRPDLKREFAARGLFRGLELTGGGFPISKKRISLDLKDATLLEVLNSIVRADGRAVWGYTLIPCQGWNQYQLKLLVN